MPTRSPDTRAATGALLERSRELSTLGAFLEDAKETSHGRFVFLAGEAGIGKRRYYANYAPTAGRARASCGADATPWSRRSRSPRCWT